VADTDVAIHRAGESDRITYISTGGGASLELLAGKDMPAIEVLEKAGQPGLSGMGVERKRGRLSAPFPFCGTPSRIPSYPEACCFMKHRFYMGFNVLFRAGFITETCHA